MGYVVDAGVRNRDTGTLVCFASQSVHEHAYLAWHSGLQKSSIAKLYTCAEEITGQYLLYTSQ
jgi:hypothetical protein